MITYKWMRGVLGSVFNLSAGQSRQTCVSVGRTTACAAAAGRGNTAQAISCPLKVVSKASGGIIGIYTTFWAAAIFLGVHISYPAQQADFRRTKAHVAAGVRENTTQLVSLHQHLKELNVL